MAGIRVDDRAEALLSPVRSMLDEGLSVLPAGPPLDVSLGPTTGFYALRGSHLILSASLAAPGVHHPDEVPSAMPPMDRWRRAAGCVLEAVCLIELGRRTQQIPGGDWRWIGAAIHAADAVAPELGLALPGMALAVEHGSPGRFPRSGIAVMRGWTHLGIDPIPQVQYLIEGGVLSGDEWLRLGAWVLSPSGLRAMLPIPVDRVEEVDIPVDLPPWSWGLLRIPAHPRGGRVIVAGDGVVRDPWAVGGAEHATLAGALDRPATLSPDPGGPVGVWEVASAEGFGQILGARGIGFTFRGDGRLELVLADAFVGPLAAVAMADEVGTSGTCTGRWSVAGPAVIRFEGIETHGLTMHGHRDRFLVPAAGFGLGEWLTALTEDAWTWQHAGPDRLVLQGRMMGGRVEVRLRRS